MRPVRSLYGRCENTMSVAIEIFISQDTVTAKLAELDHFADDPSAALLIAGEGVRDALQLYHEELGTRWRGDHYMSGPVSGQWEHRVAESWQPPIELDSHTVTVTNIDPTLAHKITGGTISAKGSGALTIPLVPEAKGVPAREFPKKLFIPKGTSVLAYKDGDGFVPVYALAASVNQGPWPGAMPQQEELQAIFDAAFAIELEPMLAGV